MRELCADVATRRQTGVDVHGSLGLQAGLTVQLPLTYAWDMPFNDAVRGAAPVVAGAA